MKTSYKLYNGEVELLFNSFRHAYTVGAEKITSVTKILSVINKPALINWSARMAVEYIADSIDPGKSYDELELNTIFKFARKAHWQKKVDAGDIGTFVHKWIEDYINGENPGMPVNENLQVSINNFLDWVKKHKAKFLVAEQVVYSRKYKYSGTLDFICTLNGKMYIGDIKTSKGIYPEYLMQTSAYRYAREEEYPKEKYAGQIILRIGKDGSFEIAIMRDQELYEEMLKAFLSAQRLQKTLNKLSTYKAEKE